MSTQDANAGAELRHKAALPQLRGVTVHLADGCMYVQPPCVEAYGGVSVTVGVECSGKRGWQPGSSRVFSPGSDAPAHTAQLACI